MKGRPKIRLTNLQIERGRTVLTAAGQPVHALPKKPGAPITQEVYTISQLKTFCKRAHNVKGNTVGEPEQMS